MADIKWIKIATDIFDNEKIKIIESMPEGDTIIVIWFKLLMAAGNVNDGGSVYFTRDIPYTDQMLATIFNRPLTTIQLALSTFEKFGMIEIFDDIIQVSNWEKYQNIEGMEKVREQNRLRKQRQREREKALLEKCHVTVTGSHATEEELEEEIDIEKDIYNTSAREKINYQEIADLYNNICVSYPKITKLSDARKKAIKARLKIYKVTDFKRLFEMAEGSSFLKGNNSHNWSATFDWLIKDSNMAKVLDGNYQDKQKEPQADNKDYDKLKELERRYLNNDYD